MNFIDSGVPSAQLQPLQNCPAAGKQTAQLCLALSVTLHLERHISPGSVCWSPGHVVQSRQPWT